MKKLLLFLLCIVFLLSVSTLNLNAQAIGEQPVADTEKKEQKADLTEKKDEKKEKTEVFTIGQIVVKKKRIANIEQATTTTIINAKNIEAHGDKDLSNTLQTVPGFTIYQHNKGHIRFTMRGFEMPYIALLQDGIPITDVYEANIDISKIPVMNASEIIINRGTCSALYGTTGTVGLINIVTKMPTDLFAKTSVEYGQNRDYTINMEQGNVNGNFYYLLTATVMKQEPYEISKKLDRSTRQEWYDKFFPSDLGYTTSGSASTTPRDLYLNGTIYWPHHEMFKYNIAAKTGYKFFDGLESGINLNYIKSESKRYTLGLQNTEEYRYSGGAYQWSNPDYTLSSGAFTWRDVYTVSASPYTYFEKGDFNIKANVFYVYTYEYLDGYADADETTPVRGWGGAHSKWLNTSAGFNVFPSYKLFAWNKINSSILFRWDKHEEAQQADPQFINVTSSVGDNSYNFAGYDWFVTKLMTGEQLTVALEDEISLSRIINVPINISAGISYDAQKLEKYKSRSTQGTTYGTLDDKYVAKSDSTIWGTRDSFNPVIGVTYEPLKDFLLLRTSFSQKAKLPTMAQYSNIASSSADVGLKPEKSYNTNIGFELFFFERATSFRTDYFYSKFKDKLATISDPSSPTTRYYTNIKGEDHQGIEVILENKFKNIAKIMDINLNLSYTYLSVRNLDNTADSGINKGKKLADIPEHQIVMDIRTDFFTKTSLNIFGEYTKNAIKYAMRSNPGSSDQYSTDYYKEVKLHNPIMLNAKISQKLFEKYEAYILCKNILDDYAADPFNPGPGRQFFFGLSAEL